MLAMIFRSFGVVGRDGKRTILALLRRQRQFERTHSGAQGSPYAGMPTA